MLGHRSAHQVASLAAALVFAAATVVAIGGYAAGDGIGGKGGRTRPLRSFVVLYAFGFDRIGVVASDLYFLDPDPEPGQEGAEQGVRLEVRLFERAPLQGSICSAQPIEVGRPIWRADLLESVDHPGSFDRAHHHPRFSDYEPGRRHFVEEMAADPVGWVGRRLEHLDGLLAEACVPVEDVGPDDARHLRRAAPEIVAAVHRLLDGVRNGELARPPGGDVASARASWL
jgi:hypothetical protein